MMLMALQPAILLYFPFPECAVSTRMQVIVENQSFSGGHWTVMLALSPYHDGPLN
jgi:hypothetical protein